MVRTLAVTAALTALLGFAVGWLTFSNPNPPRPPPPPHVRTRVPRPDAAGAGLGLGGAEATDGAPAIRFLVARSHDDGQTFPTPAPAHGGDARRPGFTTLAAAPDGSLACGWIDGRNQAQQPFFSIWPADS